MTDSSPEIRLYARLEDGGVEEILGLGTNHFDNSPMPSAGDVIVLGEGSFGRRYFLVIRRFLITTLFQSEGWALLVDSLPADGVHDEIAKQWAEDTKFFERPI